MFPVNLGMLISFSRNIFLVSLDSITCIVSKKPHIPELHFISLFYDCLTQFHFKVPFIKWWWVFLSVHNAQCCISYPPPILSDGKSKGLLSSISKLPKYLQENRHKNHCTCKAKIWPVPGVAFISGLTAYYTTSQEMARRFAIGPVQQPSGCCHCTMGVGGIFLFGCFLSEIQNHFWNLR